MISPFQIPWDPECLADLNRRLTATRWNDAVVSDWSYGMERGFLQKLVGYWRNQYVWAERRATLNRLPHFRATIDAYGLHYLHREAAPFSDGPLGGPSGSCRLGFLQPEICRLRTAPI
jgi:Epoxide hydrolase N terminus